MKEFWVIVRDVANMTAFGKRHQSFEAARAEAERLAAKGNARFLVLKAVGAVGPVPPPPLPTTWEDATSIQEGA